MSDNKEDSKSAEIETTTGQQSNQRSWKKNNKRDTSRKRRYTVGADVFKSYQKRRRKDEFIPWDTDPLNLRNLPDGSPSAVVTPESSPLPVPYKGKVEILIPPNLRDPLGLELNRTLNESDLISPTDLKTKRHKRRRTSSETELIHEKASDALRGIHDKFKDDSFLVRRNTTANITNRPNYRFTEKFGAHSSSSTVPQHQRNNNQKQNFKSKDNVKKGHQQQTAYNQQQHEATSGVNSTTTSATSKKERFQYGNYNRYYGYRNVQECDPRLELFQKDLFEGKDVLDIGCNTGHVTLTIARDFGPRKVVGIDIDSSLVNIAAKNIRHYVTEKLMQNESMPISMSMLYGPIQNFPKQEQRLDTFPHNVIFLEVNYVPESDECLPFQEAEYDCILCLSLTKWIHLNWGDDGVKRMFKRIFLHLRPGGCLLLEPQPWSTYSKKSKLTPQTLENFRSIRFKPENFNEYLLKDVGFKTCQLLGTPAHKSKGFQRPIYLYTKAL